MNLLVLGNGKTGSLVVEVAAQRKHHVRVLGSADNAHASALTSENLRAVNVVIDFTSPDSVMENIFACLRAGANLVVGTTGWYGEIPKVKALVEKNNAAFLFGSNFSIGINLFFEIAGVAATALKEGYVGQIFERHHAQKKDAPSGTALAIQEILKQASETGVEITSFREGQVVGMHELVFDSPNDNIYLCHDAKSRRGFAEGAVRGAEWLAGRRGFFHFKDVWREV
jgi:4-hydroxy-tetrahydrodipicolinate reductase